MAFGREKLPHTCTVCNEPEIRTRWGCDADSEYPQLWILCPRCLNERPHGCERCKGEGREAVHRCPLAIQDARAAEACTAAVLAEQGILPVAGGLYDQAATFIESLAVIAAMRAWLDEQKAQSGR